MKLQILASSLFFASSTFGAVIKRAEGPQFKNGQPIDGKGKGAPILGVYTSGFQLFQRPEIIRILCLALFVSYDTN
jgi:hypothetical protein